MPAKSNQNSNDSTGTQLTSDNSKDGRLPLSRFVLFFVILSIGLFADLITKSIFLGKYPPSREGMDPAWWIEGVFGVQTSLNGGALFGIGQGGSFWFALLSIAAFLAILFWLFFRKLARSLWLTLTLALVSGGILGNFYDRIGWGYDPAWENPLVKGHVRDWIHFRLKDVKFFDPWPNFNIADSLLVCGAIMLFIYAIFGTSDKTPAENESDDKKT